MSRNFVEKAIALAIRNAGSEQGGPFAALIVKQSRVIATGVNRVVTLNDPTAHAEIEAIRAACRLLNSFQLTGCEMYASCEPCPMCLGAIYWARPARVYFSATAADAASAGFDDGLIYEEFSRTRHERRIPFEQIPCQAALEPFRVWKQLNHRVLY